MANKVSTSIVLFKKRAKNNGKFPAKLRVTYNRNQRYFSIDNKERIYEFTPAEFDKITGSKPMGANVNEIRVFWNYFSDSISFPIDENTSSNLVLDITGLNAFK